MIDHVSLSVSDLHEAREFFTKALAPLDYTVIMEIPNIAIGLGVAGKPDFWLAAGAKPTPYVHMAFRAKNRAAVDAFYAAAIAAGGRDNGKPGFRPHYHTNYYGAFVWDADGNNIEAVTHAPES